MAHATRLVLALLALSCLPAVVLAHDVWATPVTACVDGPNGFGPYISWTLENDYFLRVTLTLRTATSLGPSGTVVNLDVNGSPGGKVSNVLQLISATGTTTITGRAVWTDGATIDPWTKSTNLRQPAGCVLCVATNQGQPCGSQANLAVCTSNVCVGNACVNQPVTADARCPSRRGQADGLALCTQQLCVNGTCSVTQPYVDPACPTTALPAGYEPTCNQRICANNQCVTAPWYWPATTPTGTAPACPTLGNHDAQCWRSLCVPDLTQNLPYGRGVCGGEAIDLSPATCPPPVAPNGRAVNPACYVPACVPGRGLCSITFLNGTGGADAAAHLGNCPVPAQYDAQCYWPYCDANGQCAGDVLSGTDAPNYVPAWRANMACPVPASFDQQCYRPACVAGKCGGFPVTGTILEPGIIVGSCAVPDGINPQCYVPACVAGKCSGFTITGTPDAPGMLNGQTCPLPADFDPQCFIPACIDGVCKGFPITGTPDAPGMLPGQTCPLPAGLDAACFIPACVNGSCQGFPMTGTIGAPGILPGFTCPLPAGMDPQCFVPGCVNGSCEGFPITGTADAPGMLPGQTCGVPAGFDAQCYVPACIEGVCKGFPVTGTADAPGYIGIIQCPLDPAFNPACWAPFCVDGQCSGGAINAGLPCTPSADEIVAGYTEECVLYVCSSEVTSAGHCVPTLKPMNSSCEDTGMPQDGCHEGLCIKGVCVASPTHINEPCTGDGTAPACNSYVCKLDESGNGKCVTQPAEIDGPCQTDLDMCTTQACVLDPLTNVGVCTVVETVDCSKQSSNPCDPGKCEPTTGQCVSSPAPDATACTNPDDVRCGEYSCYSGNCIRMCNCGNGMIDDGETCDWGADLWCPPLRPGEAAHSDRCPNGVEPGNVGAGNRLGLNDSLDNCNQTLCVLLRTPHRGLSTAAIAGVSIAAVAGVVALALAGGLAARAVANGGGPGAGTFGGDGAAAAAVDNPLFKSAGDLSNPLFEA